MKETLNSKLYILVVIGIVSAFGPFVTCLLYTSDAADE